MTPSKTTRVFLGVCVDFLALAEASSLEVLLVGFSSCHKKRGGLLGQWTATGSGAGPT